MIVFPPGKNIDCQVIIKPGVCSSKSRILLPSLLQLQPQQLSSNVARFQEGPQSAYASTDTMHIRWYSPESQEQGAASDEN
jgi:hypothetical protein